ncbi:MAG: hypothetical protein IT566_07750 [Rhodospirillaceae bacterium]|nr:hypothetical protein [Rhodospirillaceae bacterium]
MSPIAADPLPPQSWDEAGALRTDERAAIPADADLTPSRAGVLVILLATLPMFGQIFHYMKDLMPLWTLSKAFPILSLPLALAVFRYPMAPMSRQVLLSFLWLMVVPSFAGIFSFNQDFFTGVAAEVKLLPMLYFFSFLGLLLLLQPTLRELQTGFLLCALITFASLVILWAVIPQSWYNEHYPEGGGPLFSADHRGNRIRMPMFFGIIAIFYYYRRFLRAPRLGSLLAVVAGIVLIMVLVKTRALMVGILGVIAFNSFFATRGFLRYAISGAALTAAGVMLSLGYFGALLDSAATGFDMRFQTILKASSFLGISAMRWLFGVGTISPTSTDSLSSFFDHFFFLADITWLGIIFEFGVIGALLFLFYELRGLLFYQRALQPYIDSHFLGSLRDYLLYVLLISNLYPPTLTPGETAVILAIFGYVWLWLQQHGAEWPKEAA